MAKKNKSYIKKDEESVPNLPDTNPDITEAVTANSVKASTAEDTKIKKHEISSSFSTTSEVSEIVTSPVGLRGTSSGLTVGSYGGKSLSGAGSDGSLSSQGNSARSDTRVGKKLDSTARKINAIVSEQIEVAYKESKPINESDDVQGYSGRYVDGHFRTNKLNGGHPGDVLFDRSLDEITRDELLFIEGQYNKPVGHEYDDTPVQYEITDNVTLLNVVEATDSNIASLATSESDGKYFDVNGTKITPKALLPVPETGDYLRPLFKKGNYVVKTLTLDSDGNGGIKMSFDVDDITPTVTNEEFERSSQFGLTFSNRTELDRQLMEAKAGNENADNWTPLALAIDEPTKYNGLLRSIDIDAGSSIFAGLEKAKLAHSYQMNKAFKDGQRFVTQKEMFNQSDVMNDNFSYSMFNPSNYRNGSAEMFIDLYDSKNKYNNRADFVSQPRSLKLHLNTAKNFGKSLRVYEQFAKHFKNREAFSFLGEKYDPFLPVLITDRETEIHSLNWQDFLDSDGKPRAFTYSYGNLRGNYTQKVYHPLIKAIYDWAQEYAPKLSTYIKGGPIVIDVVHSTKIFSAWDILCNIITPYAVKNRIQSFHDVLKYETDNGYPYSGTITVEEATSIPYKNFNFISYEEPLSPNRLSSEVAIKWLLPELFTFMGTWDPDVLPAETSLYLMPWYMNEKSFDISYKDSGYVNSVTYSDTPSMSMPSLRSGTVLSSLNSLYSISERDIRLNLDMVTKLPDTTYAINSAMKYKYGRSNDGQLIIGFEGPIVVGDLLKLPREIGLSFVSPSSYLRKELASVANVTASSDYTGDTSYVAYIWDAISSVHGDAPLSDILGMDSRGSALMQQWHAFPAYAAAVPNYDNLGFNLGMSGLINMEDRTLSNKAVLTPFSDLDDSGLTGTDISGLVDKGLAFISFAKSMWFIIQRLPMLINPWDLLKTDDDQNSMLGQMDPFDLMYWHGLAGFRASDYTEDYIARSKKRAVEGITYVEDLFYKDSNLSN